MATNTNTELTSRQKSTKKRYERLKSDTPEGYPVPSTRLRFPIIPKEIEYLDIIDRKVTVKSYKSEIAGISWRAVNEKLFEDGIPAGKYSYAMKFFKNSFIYRGFIKSVNAKGDRTVNPEENNNLKVIRQTIDSLKDSLKTGQPLGIEYIMAATDKAHESELSIYKMEIAQLKEKIIELKAEVTAQDLELDKAEEIISQFKEQSSSGDIQKTLLALVNQFVKPSPELIKK
jgi:hypothetical protein